MGTKRRVCLWYKRAKGEYVVLPPNWRPDRDGLMVFHDTNDMMKFAKAARLMLRERTAIQE